MQDSLLKQAIERTCKERGMSMADLADELGLTPSSLSHKLSGRRDISLEEAFAFAKFLDQSIEVVYWLKNL